MAAVAAGEDRSSEQGLHYVAGDPLRHGLALDHTAVLGLVCAALAVAIPLAFDRRDLT